MVNSSVKGQGPSELIGRERETALITDYAMSALPYPSLGLVWGRRRVGKSYLLQTIVAQTGGFYYQAIRGSAGEALRDLGEHLADWQGAAAPLAIRDWQHAVDVLLGLGHDSERLVVLDEFPYLLEHTPELESMLQRHVGARPGSAPAPLTRLVLCGSAVSVMSQLLTGSAPLHGRAALNLRIAPFPFRMARELHGSALPLDIAIDTYAVVGGVAAYAREMTANDMPSDATDFDRWVCARVLSPAAPLFSEIELLLSEDPATAKARRINLYHATLAAIATGNHAWSSICSYVKVSSASLVPIINTLLSADLIERIDDPIRDNRPTYHPADALLRFHYAIIRRHRSRLTRPGTDVGALWRDIEPTFRSQVLGPCFEQMARAWVHQHASAETLGGFPDHIGQTVIQTADSGEIQVDVVVARDDGAMPADRTVIALGEAKVGAQLGPSHLKRLEQARDALGERATNARLLLFGPGFSDALVAEAAKREDVQLIDFDRLYHGD